MNNDSVESLRAMPREPAALPPELAHLLAGAERIGAVGRGGQFTLGEAEIDAALQGNMPMPGLPRGALHEVHAAERDDHASAAGFALLMALCAAPEGAPILWIEEAGEARRLGHLYPPGLVALGIDPARLVTVHTDNALAVLRAADQAIRCDALGAVVARLAGRHVKGLDLTATRRLALAARETGVTLMLLRTEDAPQPSAAFARFTVASAPSLPLPANAPGAPAFTVALARHRQGARLFETRLEWSCDRLAFERQRPAPLSGAGAALAAVRAGARGVANAA